ncbi:MAG: sulfurtransferase [Pseudomonadota bacterium]
MDARDQYLIEPGELAGLLQDPTLRLFDATVLFRTSDAGLVAESGIDAYRTAHIPGAAFFDHMDAFADTTSELRNTLLSVPELHAAMGAAGIGANDQVVVYSSQYLMWATRAWWMLHYAGHAQVRVLNGGLGAWQAQGGAVEAGESVYPATTFQAAPRANRYVDRATVRAAIGDASTCTIDALPEASFVGTAAHNYGRPGHIEGALNLPFGALQAEEAFLPTAQLQQALDARGMLARPRVITYCGGGIAATVDAMACLLCGQDNVAVYDGSLSEWSQDPTAPMATGAV